MNPLLNKQKLTPEAWGLEVNPAGELYIGGCNCVQLAREFGTPLHVVDEERLASTAAACMSAFSQTYPAKVSVHYAFKCNPVPGVIEVVQRAGMKAEVMTAFELFLALKLGFQGSEIVVNGPFKPDSFLTSCITNKVRFVIADSFQELKRLNRLAQELGEKTKVLLRINPDYTPKGMNSGTATGSRKGCAFGLDLIGGEAAEVISLLPTLKNLQFQGFHFHIGTGIRRPDDYRKAIKRLKNIIEHAWSQQLEVKVLDIGGGFAAPLTREMTTMEMLAYQAFDYLPALKNRGKGNQFAAFAAAVTQGIREVFNDKLLPELITEPGRSIASPNQLLLLKVHQLKNRPGIKKWLTTDGGIGTITMPAFYEFHEIFLCNDIHRPQQEKVTINGPGCFAADVVYRNKLMPDVKPGEVLAIMDSGAYFTSWESSFSHPRPAIIAVKKGQARLLRRRETFEEMSALDLFAGSGNPHPQISTSTEK